MVQVAEHLPRKCEALSSNPSTAKNKTEKPGWTWVAHPVIPAFDRQRQEEGKFKDSLSYTARHTLTTPKS
jgi:hypothetical protein